MSIMANKPGRILTSVHKTMAGLRKAGVVDEATMREFDVLCLAPSSINRKEPANLRHVPRRAKHDPGSRPKW
jgi:putative transcriptional regulator